MEIKLESQPLVSAIDRCAQLLSVRRIAVVMGDRLALGSFCLIPMIQRALVGAATTEDEGVALCERLKPDLVVATEQMEEGYGIRMIERLSRLEFRPTVLIFLDRKTPEVVAEALRSGASGVMFSSSLCTGRGDFVQALISVSEGRLYYPEEVRGVARLPFEFRTLDLVDPLSDREIEIIGAISRGLTNAEIASEFSISLETVKSHVKMSIQKLAVRDRTELAVQALICGLIPPPKLGDALERG